MKFPKIIVAIILFPLSAFSQDDNQKLFEDKETKVNTETRKELDSLYTYKWSGTEEPGDEFFEKFEKKFEQFHGDWEDEIRTG